jgi:N-acyl-D-amino-acid deacylase
MKKMIVYTFLLFPYCLFSQADVLIRNGRIIDGSGNSWYYGNLAIKDGRILRAGNTGDITAQKVIDASGLVVAPGFIDVHGHIEGSIFERPTSDNYIYDGVTTVITGNCGGSADDLKDFFRRIDSIRTSINVASLVGHNTVRKLAMGLEDRVAGKEEQARMESLVEKAMRDGAVGLSTGLIYLPGMYSNTEEVEGLAKATSRYHGVYASHIRNEENKVTQAIEEAISIGKAASIPVQISHFKVSGKANWGRSKETLQMIEDARKQGIEVTIDQYPYTASSTNLGVRLPDWALSGGTDSLKTRIQNPAVHKRIVEEMLAQLRKYKFKNYSYAVVAMHAADTSLNGKSISEINVAKGRKKKAKWEAETILDLMMAGGAQMVYHGMNEEDVRYFIRYPFNMIGADAGVSNGKGMPHPRTYGTNARVLGKYVREEKILTLEEAVRRMTSLPAQKFQLKDRGLLREGMAADIVIFDESLVQDKSTFVQPHQYSQGFHYVFVNGKPVVEKSVHTGMRSGSILYGPSKIKE